MRTISILPLFWSIMTFVSCSVPNQEEKKAVFGIYGNSISGKYDIVQSSIIGSNSIEFFVRPTELEWMNLNPSGTDRVLYYSTADRKLLSAASSVEAFAYERILDREQVLERNFKDYCHRLGRERDVMASSGFVSAYIRGIPSISANGDLFGQPAGVDLSSWFTFRDQNIIGLWGTDFTMSEQADMVDVYQTVAEFFVQDKMLPLQLNICMEHIPDEIDVSQHPKNDGDDVIKVFITIPVTFERYWDWCKALYTNPQAEEEFADGEIRIAIPFIRK